jgi:hypothetical protein
MFRPEPCKGELCGHEVHVPAGWPFAEPPNVAALTTRQVLDDGRPVLLVTHDADDGMWQVLCGTTDNPADGRVAHLQHLYERDPSIGELADLPPGWKAWREAPGKPWRRAPSEDDGE